MTVQISVIDDSQGFRWYHWRRKHHRIILKFFQNTVASEIKNLSQGDEVSCDYPWCFVFPESKKHPENFYIGALTISKNNCNKDKFCIIFSRLTYKKILKDSQKKFHLAFWQARILATREDKRISDKNNAIFMEWTRSLQRHYSPFLESVLIRKKFRFIDTCESLLSNRHVLDNQISINGGVAFMPWKNWPECIQSGNFVWLWQLSRYGRVIDAKKIPIPMDITNACR